MKILKVFLIHSHGCSSDNVDRYDTDVIIRVKGAREFGNDKTGKELIKKLRRLKLFKGVKFENE